ncbi:MULTISPECIES: septal ring lytic transglycosylase RlpA family protein [unclassified Arcicella]|uniref:septal ring lytic transglycosylase RlpA family protein n=1 Tax=unclassified Arcicella TaxID=2644986 RepID=UPI00285E910A|nr:MULTISPECIES: septal ring lytic transglycosylase RlpA family protein [unclassified Arcicella]MDR6561705.1 rare lipoprotein A [Arcicella sp. BE51]MDR6812485.1 rare lipoprotein A [Arcicella sp. BE140]MDR6823743.1 rare lipoprotein A [Arcicella sp. BE139]
MKKIIAYSTLFLLVGTSSFAYRIEQIPTKGFAEEGIARYYAAHLHGKYTSFGEKYDDTQLTASHSRYPLNTIVKVINLENNLTVEVRINDYCKCEEEGRIINLSREAASRLGMMASGKARVRIEVISPNISSSLNSHKRVSEKIADSIVPDRREVFSKDSGKSYDNNIYVSSVTTTTEAFSPERTYDINGIEKFPKGFAVQVTAVVNVGSLHDLYDELLKMGIHKDEIFIQVTQKETGKLYRLLFGEYASKESANDKTVWLSQHGYTGVVRSHFNL